MIKQVRGHLLAPFRVVCFSHLFPGFDFLGPAALSPFLVDLGFLPGAPHELLTSAVEDEARRLTDRSGFVYNSSGIKRDVQMFRHVKKLKTSKTVEILQKVLKY